LPESTEVVALGINSGKGYGARQVGVRYEVFPVEGGHTIGCISIIHDTQISRLRANRRKLIIIVIFLCDEWLCATFEGYGIPRAATDIECIYGASTE